ncbi:hypothetical protein DY245_26155 [Streptomyces inhibens]|uniref:Transposase n=1 Tax=Streptomyces inhibens TaxID=2293571 RepID=A0A371PYP5_STRIH|nr:hypothetical protein [Streptomyces inhibens]REK87560.1 hypothetical protein DY245_26155 [Streptomyces inhibens]
MTDPIRTPDTLAVDHTRHTRPLQAERRIAELENELDELRSANEILLSVATYFGKANALPTRPGIPGPPADER